MSSNLTRTARAALALACFTSVALAADDPADAVVVTATRFPERALNLPIGTRIITAEDIARSAARTLPEILGQLGSLYTRNASGSPNQQLDLRGFGITGDQNTLVLVDGVRISEIDLSSPNLMAIPLNAIERIEILAGGGAVQYGGGATGGTINIITRGPQANTLSGALLGGYGSFKTGEVRASLNAAGERLGLALYGNVYDTDNYRDNNDYRQRNLIGDLRYTLDGGSVSLKFGVNDQNLRLPGALTEAQIEADRRQAATPNNFAKLSSGFVILNANKTLGQVDFAADLAYRDSTSDAFFDSAFFPVFLRATTRTWQFSPRARWQGAPGGIPIQVVGGVDFFDADFSRRSADSESALSTPFNKIETTQQSAAPWMQVLAQFTEQLRVNLGGRLASVHTELSTVIPAPGQTQSQDVSPTALEAAFRYALIPQLTVAARIGTSYRIATVDENGFTLTGELLKPQTAKQGDLALEFRAGTLSARAGYYLIKLKNEIYFMPLIPPFGFNTNLPPTERKGWEFATRWVPTPELELAGSLNLQQAKFREGDFGGVDVAGNTIPLVPKTLGSLRASWMFLPRARLSAGLTYVGTQLYDNDQANTYPGKIPAYTLVDLKLTYDIGNLSLAASVSNLFDENYYSYGIVNTFNCPTFCAYPQAGRTAFASVQYQFK
jgi:iron complex outermembrane recepter protein